jgi:hypothetical protein
LGWGRERKRGKGEKKEGGGEEKTVLRKYLKLVLLRLLKITTQDTGCIKKFPD